MYLTEILANEEFRRHEFPVAVKKAFLAHAAVCPLPRRVAQAIAEYSLEATKGDQERFVYPAILDKGRTLASQLLSCQNEEIGFVGPTSLALSFFASGVKFRPGDNVIIYLDDYPSNVYPWLALADQGVEVRLLRCGNSRPLGVIEPGDVLSQVNEHTRLVALASAHFISGYRIDVSAIGKMLRERDILFCVDAIQTLGAFPIDLEWVDMLAADAHKWLLGPCGAGLLYVRRSVQNQVNPPVYGWHNVQCPDFIAQEHLTVRKDARKYEAGTQNLVGLVGLLAAFELLLEVGVENIARELTRKRDLLVSDLRAKGCTVLNGDAPAAAASGIVSFFRADEDLAPLQERLAQAGIVTSLRVDRTRRRYIRLSPHFYNTDTEMKRISEFL